MKYWLGKKFSFDHRRKIAEANKGRIYSAATRRKMSNSLKGRVSPRKGVTLSEETKAKLRAASLGNRNRLGSVLSEETKRKIGNGNRGPKNWHWRSGASDLGKQIRNLPEYRLWRQAVYRRDNFLCQQCHTQAPFLNADHIKSFAKIISENDIKTTVDALACGELWNTKNGRTLCVPCHKETGTFGANSWLPRRQISPRSGRSTLTR